MKLFFTLLTLVFSSISFAQELPVCTETSVEPCTLPVEYARLATIDMMLDNPKGMELLRATGENGLMLPIMDGLDDIKVTLVGSVDVVGEREESYQTTIKHEVKVLDCRGTDACGYFYLWTAVAVIKGDGYTSYTTYKNSIVEIQD
ncbi:MAG: hypothetical protein HON90_13390 [Halobacteriovoraceae bacterium]|jgi:hypothetical protein|nr:hypothetical protein [Halobacteriovoraceae bacterium]